MKRRSGKTARSSDTSRCGRSSWKRTGNRKAPARDKRRPGNRAAPCARASVPILSDKALCGAPEKSRCAITFPANNSKVSGRVQIVGTALNGSLPLTIVQVRVDDGAWQTAVGLGNWSLSVDFAKIPSGRHTIEARAFDGSLYSETASVELDVQNPGPGVSVDRPFWYIALIIVVAMVATGIFLVIRKKW